MKNSIKAILLASMFVLSGCAGGNSLRMVATATATKEAATVQPTPTYISASMLDLEKELIQNNDLPAGYSGAQIRNMIFQMYEGKIAKPVKIFTQDFALNGKTAGGVMVVVYEKDADISNAFDQMTEGMIDPQITTAGAVGSKMGVMAISDPISDSEIAFIECHAVVYVRMTDIDSHDDIVGYAQRLDKRIKPSVCNLSFK